METVKDIIFYIGCGTIGGLIGWAIGTLTAYYSKN